MINEALINQEFLAQEIASLEKWYVETVVNLIKWPVFIELLSKELLDLEDWERKTALEQVLNTHVWNQKSNEEALDQLNTIIPQVKQLIK